MKNNKKMNYASYIIILNILYVFFGMFFVRTKTVEFSSYGKSMIIPFTINVLLIIYYHITYKKMNHKRSFQFIDYNILLIVFFAIISTIFAYSRTLAIFGNTNRYEGLIAILYYFSLFQLTTFIPKEKKKIILPFIITSAVIQTIYAILQINKASFVYINFHNGEPWATGFSANPNFFAETVIISLSYVIGLFIDEEKSTIKKILCIGLIALLMIGLLISDTLSCLVGLCCVLIFLFIYCIIYRSKFTKFLFLVCVIGFLSFNLASYHKTTLINDFQKTQGEVTEISKGNVQGNYGTKRVELWRQTLKIVPKHLLHGIGLDNFVYAFDGKSLVIGHSRYDKVHNDYLQILITQGIFSLLCYLTLYGIVFVKGTYRCFKNQEIVYILPIIGYLTQIFFNISVVEVAPIFFISLGLLYNRGETDYLVLYKKFFKRFLDVLLSIMLLIILLPFLITISLCIIIIDKNNPLFIQVRTGYLGKKFKILKFKTMKNNQSTKFGKFLRSTSIDELPQLVNVLIGTMSFVGPRPWITDYYDLLNDNQRERYTIKPGIIGLAQVNGRNHITIFQKIDYDLDYIHQVSFSMDLKIVFKSFRSLIRDQDDVPSSVVIEKELRDLRNAKVNKTKKRNK